MANITKRANKKGEISFQVRVSCGYDTSGKQIVKRTMEAESLTLKQLEKELNRFVVDFERKVLRGVYSFCMCPGGVVVNAASVGGGLVTNGMSYSGRSGANANAAVCASVLPGDYGGDIQGAFGKFEHF